MRWVAPTENDEANHALEKRLWAAADQFRANSGLKAGEHSGPVLGKEVMIGGGRSRVEFCDLYSNAKEIIHVKKYGGANLLSHLFSQALVSGESFLHEPAFRVEVNKHLPQGFKFPNAKDQPIPKEFEVCIAIMSKIKGPPD